MVRELEHLSDHHTRIGPCENIESLSQDSLPADAAVMVRGAADMDTMARAGCRGFVRQLRDVASRDGQTD